MIILGGFELPYGNTDDQQTKRDGYTYDFPDKNEGRATSKYFF